MKAKRVKRTAGMVGVGALLTISLTGCGTHSASTAADQVALHYLGGPFSSKKYDSFIPASTKKWFGPGDSEYYYPNNKRTYDSTGGKGSERPAIKSTSKDTVEVATPVSVTFSLTNDPVQLRKFHESIGNRYQAYMDGDKSSEGWATMLEFYFGQALETTLDREIAGYNWRELYQDPAIRVALQDKVNAELQTLLKQQMGDDYFQNISSLVQKPEPIDTKLKENIAAQQNSIASAQSATAKAEADLKTAQAQVALQQAEANKRQADIAGFGGNVQAYLDSLMIEKGLNPRQPTYLVNSTQPAK